jgi:DNA polymerase III delta prime subunit
MKVPLIEAYRPKTFEEVIGVEHLSILDEIVKKPMEMPNLLFYGPQGTGKTTVAKIILEKLNPVDVLKLNGSSKQDRNIETFSKRVLDFASSKSSTEGKPKIIFIDEGDNLTPEAFESLRGTIERVIKNARFILTGNYLTKIPEPIQSRFSLFEFTKPKTEEILPRIKFICEQEQIRTTEEILKSIIEKNQGDIRGTINEIQQLSSNDAKVILDSVTLMYKTLSEEAFDLIMKGDWNKVRNEIPIKRPDYNKLLVEICNLFFKSDIETGLLMKATEIISEGLAEMSLSFSKDICFAAICSRLINLMK